MQKKIWGNLFAFPLRKQKRNKFSRFSFVIISVRMVHCRFWFFGTEFWICKKNSPYIKLRWHVCRVNFARKVFFFELRILLRKMLRNFPWIFGAFILWVRKNSAKLPPNFPPNFPAKNKKSPTSFCRGAGTTKKKMFWNLICKHFGQNDKQEASNCKGKAASNGISQGGLRAAVGLEGSGIAWVSLNAAWSLLARVGEGPCCIWAKSVLFGIFPFFAC